jgi:radical SAM protein with 4Fe4S-binding SPASM domain
MDLRLFEKIISEASGKSELAILHIMGEPLIHPEIHKMIKTCKQADIKTVISTNAMLLDEQKQKELCASGLDTIILSFDGAHPETFEKVRLGARYETVRNNIESFLRRKKRPHAAIQMISFDLTQNQQQDFQKLWKGYNADVLIKPYTNWQGDKEKINKWHKTEITDLRHKICDRIWRWMTIIQDGTVIPCCRDYNATIKLGNLKDNTIEQVWNNDLFRDFRLKHLIGRDGCSICKNCDYNPVVYNNNIAQTGVTLFDSYSILRLMYDLNYLKSD